MATVSETESATGLQKCSEKPVVVAEVCGAAVSKYTPHSDSLLSASEQKKVECESMTEAGDCDLSVYTQQSETTESSLFSVRCLMQQKRVTRKEPLAGECTTMVDANSESTADWCAAAAEVCDDEKISDSCEAMPVWTSNFKDGSKLSRIFAMLSSSKRRVSKCKMECRAQWNYWRHGKPHTFDASGGFQRHYIDSAKYSGLVADGCRFPERVSVLRGKLPFRLGIEFKFHVKELTVLYDLCPDSFPVESLFEECRFGIRRGPQEILFQAATDKPVLILDVDSCILDVDFKEKPKDVEYGDEHRPLAMDAVRDPRGVLGYTDVRLRPGLIEFLREVRRRYRVVLFTAACKSYKEIFGVIREHFLENGVDFDLIFTREQTLTFWRREGDSSKIKPHRRKDPTRLGFSPQFGVVLDDTLEVWAGDWAANLLIIPKYKAKGPADDFLKRAAESLTNIAKHPLSAEGDIRYAMHGITADDMDAAEKHLGRTLSRKRATDRSGALQATRDFCLMLALKKGQIDLRYLKLFEEMLKNGRTIEPKVCSWAAENL